MSDFKEIYIVTAVGETLGCTHSLTKARKAFTDLEYPVHTVATIRKRINEYNTYIYQIPGGTDYLKIEKTIIS